MKIHTQWYIEQDRKTNFKIKCQMDGRTQSFVIQELIDYYIHNGLPSKKETHTLFKPKDTLPDIKEIMEYAALKDIRHFDTRATPYSKKFEHLCHLLGIKDERTIKNRWASYLALAGCLE